MRVRFIVLLAAVFVALYVGFQQITAQNLVTCPDLVQHAIDSVGNNCGGLDRNSACYGFQDVSASFAQPQPVDYFSRPSDRARLLELEDLNTSPMSQDLDRWGIALLSVQANLPDTLPGQSVIFMMLGNTQVENGVAPEDAFQTGATVNVSLQIGADLYYEADFNAPVVGNVPQGTALTADALSADGQWVRVVYSGVPGWITRQVLTTDGDLSTLPVIGPDTKTPMQLFYFRTSLSGTQCNEAPNALVVQGPQNVTVDINANGADIRLGSTIALYLLPVDAQTRQYLVQQYGELGAISRLMQIVVLDGHVVLNAGTPNEIELNTGETSFICLAEPDNLGIDGQPNDQQVLAGCPWAPPRPVTDQEIEQFRYLDGITLNYPIDLPFELPPLTPTNTPRPGGGVFVQPTATLTPTSTPTDTPPPPPLPGQPTYTPSLTPTNTDTPVATATFTPTNTDTPTATATVCDPIPDPATDVSSLIAAIHAANDETCHPGTDTINLTEAAYSVVGADNDTNGPNGLPAITSSIIIQGNGGNLFVDASTRIFYIAPGASLSLNDVDMTGGYTDTNGGAIYNDGTLSLSGLAVNGASAVGNGGGLYNTGGATFNYVTVNGNGANNGGGVYNAGTLGISNTTISNNIASLDGAGVYSTGTFNADHSAFIYNTGSGAGGALYNSGSASLVNSTVSSNNALAGFGILNANSTTLNYSTVYGNYWAGGTELLTVRAAKRAAMTLRGGPAGYAAVASLSGTFSVKAAIIAGNNYPDCNGAFTTYGNNFDDDGTCTGFTPTDAQSLNINPSLSYNGGATQNHALNYPSVAIDTNDCGIYPSGTAGDDQTGFARPTQSNATPSPFGDCDAGAYEFAFGRTGPG